MLSQSQRTTIVELAAQGVGKREIGRVLGISRVAVRQVLRSQVHPGAGVTPGREGRTLPAADPGAFRQLQGESRASP